MRCGRDAIAANLLMNRRVARAPIWLYRHRAGWVLGPRVLLLEHLGRKSGLPRCVCLEVVDRPSPATIVIVSGFGERAQWYRNLVAHPDCFVTLGHHRLSAHARMMSTAEAAAALKRYQAAHPRAWKRLHGAIEHAVGHPVDQLPMIELLLGPS